MINSVELKDAVLSIFSCACWPSAFPLWKNVQVYCPFLNWVVFLMLSCMSCLYILDINPLSVISFANIFSHWVACLFLWQYLPVFLLLLWRSRFFKVLPLPFWKCLFPFLYIFISILLPVSDAASHCLPFSYTFLLDLWNSGSTANILIFSIIHWLLPPFLARQPFQGLILSHPT